MLEILSPVGYFQIRRSGGGGGELGPHIKFEGKIWGKVRPSSPNKRKNLGSSVTTRRKSWEKVPILGSYLKFRGQSLRYLSLTFWKQNLGLQQEFQRQILGPSPPDHLIWKYPLWDFAPLIGFPREIFPRLWVTI